MIDLKEDFKFDNIDATSTTINKADIKPEQHIKKVTLVYKNKECKNLFLKAYKFEGWEVPILIKREQKLKSEQIGELFIVDLIDCDDILARATLLNSKIANDKTLVVIGQEDKINTLNLLNKMGVHYLLWPMESHEIIDQIRLLSQPEQMAFTEHYYRRAKRIAVIGTRGGCGTSIIASEITAALAKEGSRTILADHHYLNGNIDILLSRKDLLRVDIGSITVDLKLLDEESTENYLSEVSKNFLYLALEGVASQSTLEKYTEGIINKLKRKTNFIIDDYSSSIDFPLNISSVATSSHIIIVVIEPSVTSIRNTQNVLDKINEASLTLTERPRIIVIINHHRPSSSFSFNRKEVEQFISRKVDLEVPYYKNATSHLLDGKKLLDLGGNNTNPFLKLGKIIIGEELKNNKSLIQRWFIRSKE